jgi:hypothetical protein
MHGLAYVIIPVEFASPQRVLDETLAACRRGGLDAFPREKLVFDDVTDVLRRLHETRFDFKIEGGLSIGGGDLECVHR